MPSYRRQTLAAYGFFENARREHKYTEDALVPFILPSIAGKAGEIFSAEQLAKELEPVFGPELVLHLAESLVETLTRGGYLKRGASGPKGSLYLYTDKTSEIPLSASVSRAEEDLGSITSALKSYLNQTTLLKPIDKTDDELANDFADWITTVDSPSLPGTGALNRKGLSRASSTSQSGFDLSHQQLELLFSSFVTWSARERLDLFEKIAVFAEIGLVIDLVSEIRVPTLRHKRVDLSIVIDSTVLLELLGLCGPLLQRSARRLMEMCKKYKIGAYTLTHLVDEVSEICYSVINNPNGGYAGSVSDAIRKFPGTVELVRQVYKSPDTCIKAIGITIVTYSNSSNSLSTKNFDANNIAQFCDYLGYDRTKPIMAKRDAWSLAYAVRRQGGIHTSNLYESKCIIITRSPVFAARSRLYLKSEGLYPGFAVTPVMELRHFSTMFMLAFGTGATENVVRAELVASCDKIVRASPGLTQKIKSVLERINKFSEDQLESVLSNPTMMAEFTLATGNDPAVVTPQNGETLLEVIRSAAVKDERLKFQERENERDAEHHLQLKKSEAATLEAAKTAERAAAEAHLRASEAERLIVELEKQADLNASILAHNVICA